MHQLPPDGNDATNKTVSVNININNYNQALSEYKHVLANIFRSRYVARMPPLEARSPGRRRERPLSTASHWPASHAHLRYTVRNVENASVTRRLLITNQQRAGTPCKLGFVLCCHCNATGAPIANPPNSAQLGGSLYYAPKLHPGPCSSVGVRPRTDTQTHRHTDARDHNTFCVIYDSRKM